MKVTFKKQGTANYMGFTWYAVYENNQPLIQQGVHLRYLAKNMQHAKGMHTQLISLTNK